MLRAYCNREKIDKLLDGRRISWLVEQLELLDITVSYKNMVGLLNNRSEWKLTIAMGVCMVFNRKIEEVFYLKK